MISDVCTNNLIPEELVDEVGSVCIDITKLPPDGPEVAFTVKIPASCVKGTSVPVKLTLFTDHHTTCGSLKGLMYTDALGCRGNNALISCCSESIQMLNKYSKIVSNKSKSCLFFLKVLFPLLNTRAASSVTI